MRLSKTARHRRRALSCASRGEDFLEGLLTGNGGYDVSIASSAAMERGIACVAKCGLHFLAIFAFEVCAFLRMLRAILAAKFWWQCPSNCGSQLSLFCCDTSVRRLNRFSPTGRFCKDNYIGRQTILVLRTVSLGFQKY